MIGSSGIALSPLFFVMRNEGRDANVHLYSLMAKNIGLKYFGLAEKSLLAGKSETGGHPHEISKRLCTELFHDVVAVNLHSDLTDADFRR